MIYDFLNFLKSKINEGMGTEKDPDAIYWKDTITDLLDKHWTEMSITVYSKLEKQYFISFKAGDDKYGYCGVLLEIRNGNDFYYLEDSTEFVEKLKEEFWSNNTNRIDNLVYVPKCLGSIESIKRGKNSGLMELI